MTFQFQCPQGHLLEGEESHVGQQCQCPTCGMMFPIPAPSAAPAVQAAPAPPAPGQFDHLADAAPPEQAFPDVTGRNAAAIDPGGITQPQLLHIPCPSGHELEVPPDMIGQDVMCPHCGVQFRLREKDSVESKRRRQQEQEVKDHRSGKNWFMWAIIVAALVLIGLVILIAVSS